MGDERFVLSRSPRRQGFYANFERVLAMVPSAARFVALCDQDDRWHPKKLEILLAAIGSAALAFSDARIVDRHGHLASHTYWSLRPPNWTDLSSLVLANSVSGGAAVFRRALLDFALPFPPSHGRFFHDHWLAIVALTIGGLEYVDRPLYDYVQHESAALGHEASPSRRPNARRLREKLRIARADPGFFYGHWRTAYFHEYCRAALLARVLLMRCDRFLSGSRRRALERLIALDRSPLATGWIAGRRLQRRLGTDETLGAEGRLLRALLWRHCLSTASPLFRSPPAWVPTDAGLPGPGAQRSPL